MTPGASAVMRTFRSAFTPDPTDRDLLARFAGGDQSAFAELVKRHGNMVFGVCRRALPTTQDAEDAGQAVFLILAHKAGRERWQESVANWLYTTARRVAADARRAAVRRGQREARVTTAAGTSPLDEMTGREVLAALDEELDRLPAIYREPLVLCYLEGLARDEAATRLGVPLATLKSQLDRGRRKLGAALTRRGVALGAGLLAVAAAAPAGATPPRLIESVRAAVSGSVPARVGELVTGAVATGTLWRVKLAAAGVFGLLAFGFALAVPGAEPDKAAPATGGKAAMPAPKGEPLKDAKAAETEEPERQKKRVEVKGVVLSSDGKPVAGAKLFLNSVDKFVPAPQAAAGADGAFAFTVAEDELSTIVATAPGHGLTWGHLSVRPLTLRLVAEERIRGKVVNLEGKPVAGVSVSAVELYRVRGDKTLDQWLEVARDPKAGPEVELDRPHYAQTSFDGLVAPATSDRDGTFEIAGVGRDHIAVLRAAGPTAATHQVTVVARPLERFTVRGATAAADETYHGSAPLVVAAPVPVTTGRVLDGATGKPIPGTVLWVEGVSQQNKTLTNLRAVADADGRFTLPGVPTGIPHPAVTVFPPSGAPYHRERVPVPDGAAGRAAFDVRLTRGVPATVKIIDRTTGRPVRALLGYGVFNDDNPHVKTVPNAAHNMYWLDSEYSIVTKSEYRIVVFPGKGLVAVKATAANEYLYGVGVGGFEKHRTDDQLYGLAGVANLYVGWWHTLAEIDVPADAKEFTVTLELERGQTAAGRLLDGDGKAVVGAESWRLYGGMSDGGWAAPNPEATFTACALRPGEKKRVMFVHTERKLAGTAVVVGGAKGPVEVRMEPWGEVTGRLVGADGKPVAGRLNLLGDVVHKNDLSLGSSPVCHPGGAGVTAGPDGRFRITGLVPGLTYRWTAGGPNGASATVPDAVPKSGRTIDLGDIRLPHDEP